MKQSRVAISLCCAASFALLSIIADAADSDRFMVEQILDRVLNLRTLGQGVTLAISPDGRTLAATVEGPHNRRLPERQGTAEVQQGLTEGTLGCEVVLLRTDTGEATRPFPAGSTTWLPAWSPDGRRLAAHFVGESGPPRLAVWGAERSEHRVYSQATVSANTWMELPRWTADSKSLVFLHVPKIDDSDQSVVRVLSHEPGTKNYASTWELAHPKQALARLDLDSGKLTILCPDAQTRGWKLSPDDKHVAFLQAAKSQQIASQSTYYELAIAALDGSGVRVVAAETGDTWAVDSFSWSPDGRHIALLTHGNRSPSRLLCVNVREKQAIECQPPTGEVFGGWTEYDFGPAAAPLWSSDGRTFWVVAGKQLASYLPDGKLASTMLPPMASQGNSTWLVPPTAARPQLANGPVTLLTKTGIARVDLATGKSESLIDRWPELLRPRYALMDERTISADGNLGCYVARSKLQGYRIARFDLREKSVRLLREISPGYEGANLGELKTLDWKLPDGRTCHGALLLPPGYRDKEKLPVIVELYASATDNGRLHVGNFDSRCLVNPHVLATAGYAVFRPDLPVTGHDPSRQIPGLVKAATDRLVELGYADPKRIGLMGNSYGCCTVFSVLTQTGDYRAAVACNGTVDLVRTATDGGFSWTEQGQGAMGGSLWEHRQRYIENSPLFHLDRVTTPVLLVRGGADLASAGHLEAAYNSLVRLDKRVELRIYPGQGHWPQGWATDSQRDLHLRLIAWFDRHLK